MKNKKYPENYFIGIGIILGIPLGIIFGMTLKNPAFFGIGLPIGFIIGLALEEKYKKQGKIRPLTEKEKKRQNIGLFIGIGILIIGFITFLLLIK